MPNDATALTANFLESYKRLLNGEAIKSFPKEDAMHSSIIPPKLVIMDVSSFYYSLEKFARLIMFSKFFLYDAMQGVRQTSGRSVPIYALQSVSAAALLFLWGPEEIGGGGDLLEKLGSLKDTGDEETNKNADKVIR